MNLENKINIIVGIGELGTDLLISSQVIQLYQGDAPLYIALPYAATHLFLMFDAFLRIANNQSMLPLTRLYKKYVKGEQIDIYPPSSISFPQELSIKSNEKP